MGLNFLKLSSSETRTRGDESLVHTAGGGGQLSIRCRKDLPTTAMLIQRGVTNTSEKHEGEMKSCIICESRRKSVTLGEPHRLKQAWNDSIRMTIWGGGDIALSPEQIHPNNDGG